MNLKIVVLILASAATYTNAIASASAASALIGEASVIQTRDASKQFMERSSHAPPPPPTLKGIWRKRVEWRARWVKTWRERKVYEAVWKKMWGPAVVREWVPVPRPPPGWAGPDGPFALRQLPPH